MLLFWPFSLLTMAFLIFMRCYQEDELTKMYAESRIPPSMFQPRVNWYIENLTIYIAFYALLRVIIMPISLFISKTLKLSVRAFY